MNTASISDVSAICDIDALRQAEKSYRDLLEVEPGAMDVRVDLAWCLFMQAVHMAGQESAIRNNGLSSTGNSVWPTPSTALTMQAQAQMMLNECLQNAVTVTQLSTSRQDQMVMNKLETLVKLACGEKLISSARINASRILADLTQAVMRSDQDSCES